MFNILNIFLYFETCVKFCAHQTCLQLHSWKFDQGQFDPLMTKNVIKIDINVKMCFNLLGKN